MRYIKTNTLSCFSPPVMIATFAIEIGLAIYVSWRYKVTNITKLAIAILFFLAVFQLAEYNVCEGSFGIDPLSWSRLGYVAITMLPPLGFHLATRLAGQKQTLAVTAGYVGAGLFAAFFAFSGTGLTASACLGNYVIFKTAPGSSLLYAAYYYGWLLAGIVYCWVMAGRQAKPNQARALKSLMIGYIMFVLPTTAVNIVDPSTIAGIPSIMCGFAVLLAVILAGEVIPHYYMQPSLSQKQLQNQTGRLRGKATK
jgi:hypothetical protein